MIRFLSVILISLISISVISCTSSARKKETEQKFKGGNQRPPVRADAYIAKTSTLFDKIEIPGSIVANESTDIHPEVAGRITGIYFREGSFVGRGALLVKLNDADLQAQKRKLLVQMQIAKQNENRSSELLKIQGISKQDYEATLLQVNNINADLSIIQTQIEKTNIRAPFSGKVGFRMVSPGAYVSPASTLTTISQTSGLKIDFNVPERYIAHVKNGDYIKFKVEGSNRNYSARIIATESNITADTRTLNIRAMVQGDQAGLTPGNFAKVIFDFPPEPNAIMVPSQAIIPQARGKKVYLYQNGKTKFVDVTTGIRDSSNVQITSGLNPGDTVLITGLLMLKPDAKVKLGRVVNGTIQPREGEWPRKDSLRRKKQ
ncbi:MAG: efflux RND transporter periplasmic adaptor subunit [Candidatus Dadabacteria bacterium]